MSDGGDAEDALANRTEQPACNELEAPDGADLQSRYDVECT